MFSSCSPKFFAFRHIFHYPVDPSSDHFCTDAVVLSSDHYCIERVGPSGDHYYIDIVVPSSDHCYSSCTETVPPSIDDYGTTNVSVSSSSTPNSPFLG